MRLGQHGQPLLKSPRAGADGTVRLTGHHGDDDRAIHGETKRLTVVRGTTSYHAR